MRKWQRGKLLVVSLFAILFLFTKASAKVSGRLFGDFGVTATYDDSIFRDASKKADALFPAYIGIGWKGKFTKQTLSRAYYRFSYRSFAKESLETYSEHFGEVAIQQRLYGRLFFHFNFETEIFNQPNFARFNSRRLAYQPGLELRIFPQSRLRAAFSYETQDYPNFDFDYKSPGFKLGMVQELTPYGSLNLTYAQQTKNYQERRLFLDASGTLSQEKRKDEEKQLEIIAEGDWRYGGISAGYTYSNLNSNGNIRDFGPNQSANLNTILIDDQVISNYYSHVSKGPVFSGNLRIFNFILVSLSYRLQEIIYEERIAKDQTGSFVEGNQKRKDDRNLLSSHLTFFQSIRGLTLGWTLGWRKEKSNSNDSLYQFDNNQFFVGFRGWF